MYTAKANMRREGCRSREYLAKISPWMDCVNCWERFLAVDEAERGQRTTRKRNPLAVPLPAAQYQFPLA